MSSLKNGNPRGKGGGGSQGFRAPAWLRKQCLKAVKDGKLVKLLADIATGKIKDHKVAKDGRVIEVEASLNDKRGAAEYLIDRVGGKSQIMMDLTSGGGPLTVRVANYADMAPKPEEKKSEEPKA